MKSKITKLSAFVLLLLLSFSSTYSQSVKSLGDINKVKNQDGPILSQVQSGNNIFFSRTTAEFGHEPWITDGTPAGTRLLKDIVPGADGSEPVLFSAAKFGDTYGAYFIADTPATGYELWVTDGTLAGTKMIQDLNPGVDSAFEEPNLINSVLVTLPEDSFAYFAATNGATGTEPYYSNGVENDINIWVDLEPGADSSDPKGFKFVSNVIAFSAETSAAGRELYIISFFPVFDDINPGNDSSDPANFFVLGGTNFLFTADDGASGMELRKYDGGTILIKDTTTGPASSLFSVFNQINDTNLVFSTVAISDALDSKIWSSDGTEVGTTLLKDVDCIPGGIFALVGISEGITTSKVINGKVVFPCSEFNLSNSGIGEIEPWVTDGTVAGTKRLKDIASGQRSSDVLSIYKLNNKLLFFANNHKKGFEPWVTDGTEEGTRILKDFNPGAASSGDYFSQIVGVLNNNTHATKILISLIIGNNRKVFITDGELANTVELFDHSIDETGNSSPSDFVGLGKSVIFPATNGAIGRQLFQTKGTKKSTKTLKNIFRGNDASPSDFIKLNKEQVIFTATHPSKGREVFSTDGTTKGTKLLRDVHLGNFGSDPVIFENKLKKKIFFSANTINEGRELWITNGKKRGTKIVKDIYAGVNSANPDHLVTLNGRAIFKADSDLGSELWITNGRSAGTSLLKDLYVGADSSNPSGLVKLNDKVIFSAYTDVLGRELYVTDGTEAGTTLLKDIYPDAISSSPENLTVSGNFVYFIAGTNAQGRELWRTDGTEAGTIMIQDYTPGAPNTTFGELAPIGNDQVVLLIDHPAFGRELHLANPNANSITLLKDINVGADDSTPEYLYNIPNKNLVYFRAYSPATGRELYRTDGTEAGTVLVQDINTGTENGSPYNFYFYKGKLYFSASTPAQGDEAFFVRVN